jgi:hypothetical protein
MTLFSIKLRVHSPVCTSLLLPLPPAVSLGAAQRHLLSSVTVVLPWCYIDVNRVTVVLP